MRIGLINLIVPLGLLGGGCARDNPMFELEAGAGGTTASTAGVGDDGSDRTADGQVDTGPTSGSAAGDSDTGSASATSGHASSADDGATSGGAESEVDDGSEESGAVDCVKATHEQALRSIADTFVASDSGPYCSEQSCENQNFGARASMAVTGDDLDGREVYLLARFQLDEIDLSTVLFADLELTIGGESEQEFADVGLVAIDLLDQSWVEGTGGNGGAGPSVATVGQSSWFCSSCPVGWDGPEAPFPAAIGDEIGWASENFTMQGDVFQVPLDLERIVPADDGTYSLAVARVDNPNEIPLRTREANADSITLRVFGCK